MKIFNKFKINFLSKAYTEGIYADTPANRKLGRVGMTYEAYAEKVKKEKESSSEESEIKEIIKKEGEKKAAEIIKKHLGINVDFIFRAEKQFTVSFEGSDKSKISTISKLFKNAKVESDYDEELNETFVYIDMNNKNTFTINQIKEKVQSEIKKLKKKNDYVTLSDSKGNTYRFSYNRSADENGKGFNECLVKDKEGNVLKTFKNSYEEDLMNSVYKYIQSLDTDIIPVESGGSEEVSIEHNTTAIKKKMQEAKDSQTGTILVKGSGDKLIYLNRDRKGRWLKDFNNYTIRDSKRNIISQGKADSEEDLINKLNEYLSKNKIKLEI